VTSDFDTIRSALQLHILGAASLNDWKIASDALSRVQAASEQAEKALAGIVSLEYEAFQAGEGYMNKLSQSGWIARSALAVLRGKDTR